MIQFSGIMLPNVLSTHSEKSGEPHRPVRVRSLARVASVTAGDFKMVVMVRREEGEPAMVAA